MASLEQSIGLHAHTSWMLDFLSSSLIDVEISLFSRFAANGVDGKKGRAMMILRHVLLVGRDCAEVLSRCGRF
jgi:hypothetical protein